MSLRSLLASLTLALASWPSAHAQTVAEPFSIPRVGDVIDPHERRYFGLFPDYRGDVSLHLEWASPDSVQAVAVGEGE